MASQKITGKKWSNDMSWGGGLGTPAGKVTWQFDPLTEFTAAEKEAIRKALQTWEDLGGGLRFVYDANRPSDAVGITFGMKYLDGNIDFPVVDGPDSNPQYQGAGDPYGPGNQIAYWTSREFEGFDNFAPGARIDFDYSDWASDAYWFSEMPSFYAVALHEIGHALGLGHVSDPTEIMNATLSKQKGLGQGDIQAFHTIYGGSSSGENVPFYLRGDNGPNSLVGKARAETIEGKGGHDALYGNGGNDILRGGSGNDALFGGNGKDTLEGGAGKDVLFGGKHADLFVYKSVKHSPATTKGRDVIDDFSRKQGDKIHLKAIDAKTGTKKNDAFKFVSSDKFSASKGELRVEKKGQMTFVYGDVNGDAKADFAIELTGRFELKKDDFVL